MDIHIRDARLQDASIIAQAEREIAKYPGFLISQPAELADENFGKKIMQLSTIRNGKYIVAEIDDKIVGHASLDPLHLVAIQHVVHLTIVTHNSYQSKGVGNTMLTFLVDWARENPTIEKIELHVRSSNIKAISLYKKLGFQEEGRWKQRVKIGDKMYLDDIIMGLWVGQA